MKKLHMAIAVAAVSVVTLAGCASGESAEPVPEITEPTLGSVPDGVLDGHTLTFAGDGGSTQDGMMSAWFDPFAAASGATFNQDAPQTMAKIESQVES